MSYSRSSFRRCAHRRRAERRDVRSGDAAQQRHRDLLHPADELTLDVVERLEVGVVVVAVEWVVEVVVVEVVEVVVAVAAAGKAYRHQNLVDRRRLEPHSSVGVRFRPIPHATFSSCSRRIPPRCSSSAPMFGSITTCCASASFDTHPSAAPSAARSARRRRRHLARARATAPRTPTAPTRARRRRSSRSRPARPRPPAPASPSARRRGRGVRDGVGCACCRAVVAAAAAVPAAAAGAGAQGRRSAEGARACSGPKRLPRIHAAAASFALLVERRARFLKALGDLSR